MAKDQDPDGEAPEGGRRIDGKPYKDDNTRPDGSYEVGRNRPPKHSQFAVADGRKRGSRTKGTKNVLSEWREELDAKITVNEGGKTRKITKRRALIKTKIDRGIKGSDRASDTALRYAELSEKREPGLQSDDLKMIERWLGSMLAQGDSDDRDFGDAEDCASDEQSGGDEA